MLKISSSLLFTKHLYLGSSTVLTAGYKQGICRLPVVNLFVKNMASSPDKTTGTTKGEKEPENVDSSSVKTTDKQTASPAQAVTRGSKVLRQTREDEVEKTKEKFMKMKLADKRKLYKCGDRYTRLEDVEIWPQHYYPSNAKWWACNKSKVTVDVRPDLNEKMSLFCGDITTLEIDAIANAANESLLGGGGVDGAIHAASGPHLRSECELLRGCEPGDAKITLGYKLPAAHVVHTVGPRGERPAVLKTCYTRSLDLLKANNLRSIAFPCISTGIFGYPNLNAAKVALGTIRNWLETDEYAKNIDRIIMCLFLKKDIDIYNEQMQMFFPLHPKEEEK